MMKNVKISTTADIPIYHQLYEQISIQILNGDMEANTLLPSIRTMAKEIRVSVITIKKAWEELERDGYIYTIAGKGSYVADNSKSSLSRKRVDFVKERVELSIKQIKDLGISKEALLNLIDELYEQS